jgi:hypothetical protein
MKQARRGLGGWRLTVLMLGLVSMLMTALPAQAGLGDLLDDLLDPVEDIPIVGDVVEPIVDDVVDPIVEDVVNPLAGDLLDPIAEEVLAPIVTPIVGNVVAPVVEELVTPVLDSVVPPVIEPVVETIPPVETPTTTTTTVPPFAPTSQEVSASESSGFGVSSTGYPGGVVVASSSADREVAPIPPTTELESLAAALALQTALVKRDSVVLADSGLELPAEVAVIDAGWLDGLTNWLRNSADGLLNVLALPIRLLELLARALLTAGSGLIAPLSLLLAFTAILIKDRGWVRTKVLTAG